MNCTTESRKYAEGTLTLPPRTKEVCRTIIQLVSYSNYVINFFFNWNLNIYRTILRIFQIDFNQWRVNQTQGNNNENLHQWESYASFNKLNHSWCRWRRPGSLKCQFHNDSFSLPHDPLPPDWLTSQVCRLKPKRGMFTCDWYGATGHSSTVKR